MMQILAVMTVILLSVSSSGFPSVSQEGGRRLRRQSDGGGIKQGCTTTGYETRFREACVEEFEEVCKTVTSVEYKKEIVTKCDTRLQQKCNTTTRAVPREVCVQRNRTECFPDFRIVSETSYTNECENIVQHICEEHYHVPVPPPPPFIGPAPFLGRRRRRGVRAEEGGARPRRESTLLTGTPLLLQLKHALKLPPPPLLHHQELPAPPGCRSLVTQKCHKVPVNVVRKVPAEQCEEVQGVKCHLELVEVEEPECGDVPVEECKDELKETPFLVDEEECEDVPKIVCTEIEEQVPIQVCRTVDVLRTPIVVGKGKSRDVSSIRGIGVRAKVVGRLPEVGDVGEKNRGGAAEQLKLDLKPGVIERLRSQIFDKTEEPRNKRARPSTSGLRRERMRKILKKFISEHLQS